MFKKLFAVAAVVSIMFVGCGKTEASAEEVVETAATEEVVETEAAETEEVVADTAAVEAVETEEAAQ